PSFTIRQNLYEELPFEILVREFDSITSSAYSVSLFTSWRHAFIDQVWLKQAANDAPRSDFLRARPAALALHPLPGMPVEYCTEQLGVEGPWHERLPHFRLEFTPSSGEELQSEYLVPRQYAPEALGAIQQMGDKIVPLLHISEIRTISADELWMSPC